MKKLLSLAVLSLAILSTSCAYHRGGCCGSQCDMKKEKCEKCKDGSEQCPMKHGEEKKEEVKK